MPKRRAFIVYVDLDPVPGMFHTESSAKECIWDMLRRSIPHYHPTVLLAPDGYQIEDQPETQEK